ncbi:hypothetical protein ACTJJB_01705 [Chitinophaga sp. 22536]|uniref:hypothetical protein n=1 Tax=unclassified Chitinophaga TaxID=2619133 RepID=UPI003F85CDAB
MAQDGNIEIKGMVLKPFDYERAITGARVVTRSGKRVTNLMHFDDAIGYVLAGTVDGLLLIWYANGNRFEESEPSQYDLFMAHENKTMYCSVYLEVGHFITGNTLYETPEQAESDLVDGSWVGEVTFQI